MSIPGNTKPHISEGTPQCIPSTPLADTRRGIPVTIGVTGHRDLRLQDIPKLRELVRIELQKIRNKCQNSPVVMLNSLARGADQLCAEFAIELGISLVAVLPLDIAEYRKDFEGESLEAFERLCSASDELFVAPATETGADEQRDFRYRQAGIYIASHSHVLIALWDGSPPSPGGCGTAETVGFMLDPNYSSRSGSFFKADSDGAVIHIITPKPGKPEPEHALTPIMIENVKGSFDASLSATDCFNRDARSSDPDRSYPLIDRDTLFSASGNIARLHDIYRKADALSIAFQDKYLATLKLLSVFGVCLTLAFLLYDEMESNLFLPFYGLILILSFISLRLAQKGYWHKKYLEYRALAETLRVQFYLSISGICHNICDSFVWSQKNEIVWIKEASSALSVGTPAQAAAEPEKVKAAWIDEQLDYHVKKHGSIASSIRISSQLTNAMLAASVVMYAVICLMELFAPVLMSKVISLGPPGDFLIMHKGQAIILRGLFKIILGVISAIALFLSNYYGKLSLRRKISDNEKMAALYRAAQRKWNEPGICRENVMVELAREELIENGFWLSYCRDNVPDINI